MKTTQPKTGQACGCKPGQQRDNCPQCEGTGQRIDFAAIRAAKLEPVSEYDNQVAKFLADHSITFRATLADSKPCPWHDDEAAMRQRRMYHAEFEPHHYRVTLSKRRKNTKQHGPECECVTCCPVTRMVFDFWGSIADAQKGIETVTPYSVLACISSDTNCPDTFTDFCSEFGYKTDSIKALQLFRRCDRFGKRLRAFFTAAEIEQLSEIQ